MAIKMSRKTIFKESDTEVIERLYWEDEMTLNQIGNIFNTNPSVVSKFMEKHNIKRRNISESTTLKVDDKGICDLYSNNYSMEYVSKQFNISISKVNSTLNNNNIFIRSRSEATKTEDWQTKNRIFYMEKHLLESLYIEQKLSSLEIAEIYNVEYYHVLGLLHYYGIQVRKLDDIFNDIEFRNKLKENNIRLFGKETFMETEDFRVKQKETFELKYNVDNPFKLNKFQIKARETLSKNGNVNTSRQQLYTHKVVGGELNYVDETTRTYVLDIAFPKDKIYIEYNGGGHNLNVKLGSTTEVQFAKKELNRYFYLSRNEWRNITITSLKDFLPSEDVILDLIEFSRDYFKTGHHWIKFDIDNSKIITSQYAINVDYGSLRKIKGKDLEEVG